MKRRLTKTASPIAGPRADLPADVDPALWFHHLGCTGRHYLLGNPHTVPGRIWAWCPREQRSFFLAKAGMGRMSSACRHWLAGYLHGCEPDPPLDAEGTPAFGTREYAAYQRRCRSFHDTGAWPANRRTKATTP